MAKNIYMKKSPKKKFFSKKKKSNHTSLPQPINQENLRLNKFMAHCGVANRRACEIFIQKGLVTVNDKVITDSAYRVQKEDIVRYEGKILELKKQYVYILLNKPKGYTPSFEKIEGEKTFQNIFSDKIKTSISPLENLAKRSAGLVLITDDEFLLEKKSKKGIQFKSIFHIILSNPISEKELQDLRENLTEILPNIQSIHHVKEKDQKEIMIQMKGENDLALIESIESQGVTVEKVDRVSLNNLTKKDLPRGRFRLLTEKEGIFLKHFS